jgi:hypothetical protein
MQSFWYNEAEKQFKALENQDPSCAMASWGEAMGLLRQLHPGIGTGGLLTEGRYSPVGNPYNIALHLATSAERFPRTLLQRRSPAKQVELSVVLEHMSDLRPRTLSSSMLRGQQVAHKGSKGHTAYVPLLACFRVT